MSLKTKTIRFVALGVFSAPAMLLATEPRIIVPSKAPTKVVFESDNATFDVLNRFRNTRSSEQIHFQAIETLFPRVPDRESVREGYSMVKEIVDAKKAALQAAAELEAERARLEAARAELEAQAQAQQAQTWEAEPEEFDYYDFADAANVVVEPQPRKSSVRHHHSHSTHNGNSHRAHGQANSNRAKNKHVHHSKKASKSVAKWPWSSGHKRAGRAARR